MKLIQQYWMKGRSMPFILGETPHDVYDANLKGGATLHRFINPGGVPYSAIYIGNDEVWSHTRENEKRMIKDWNEWGYK